MDYISKHTICKQETSVIYENEQDRTEQTAVVEVVREFLADIPIVGEDLLGGSHFEIVETDRSKHLSHDFNVSHDGKWVAVGEIKCRKEQYNLEYFKLNGWMIAKERLSKLREHDGKGKHVMIVLRTSDGFVLFVMLKTLMANGKRLTPAGEGSCKTDHGSKPKDEHGLIIPFDLLKRMGKCVMS